MTDLDIELDVPTLHKRVRPLIDGTQQIDDNAADLLIRPRASRLREASAARTSGDHDGAIQVLMAGATTDPFMGLSTPRAISTPITYSQLRATARNGDVISMATPGVVSLTIRAVTDSIVSHCAILVWLLDRLMVAEFREGIGFAAGFRLVPASQYIEHALSRCTRLDYSVAPQLVHDRPELVEETALSCPSIGYGFPTLLGILFSKLVGRTWDTDALVCSVYVQRVFEACGVQFSTLADPGKVRDACVRHYAIEGM